MTYTWSTEMRICHSDGNKSILPSLDRYADFDTDKFRVFVLDMGRNAAYVEYDGHKSSTGNGIVLIANRNDVEKCTNGGKASITFDLKSVFRFLDSDDYAVCSQSKIALANRHNNNTVTEEYLGSGNSLVDIYQTMMELDLAAIPYVTIDLSINGKRKDPDWQ